MLLPPLGAKGPEKSSAVMGPSELDIRVEDPLSLSLKQLANSRHGPQIFRIAAEEDGIHKLKRQIDLQTVNVTLRFLAAWRVTEPYGYSPSPSEHSSPSQSLRSMVGEIEIGEVSRSATVLFRRPL